MTRIRKLLQSLRAHPRLAGVLALGLCLLAGAAALQQRAADEAQARQLPEVRHFEADAQTWLHNEKSLADFRRSLGAGELTAVALATSTPGLVLYTLKNGDKASTTVPGCSPAGCAGTLLDGLGERSAEAGFALVSVHVDPRTTSHRLLGAAETVLAPLLVIGLVLGALFVVTRLQMGLGGASMLTVQPSTRFADVVGSDEAKAALARVRAFLGEPAKYARLGATPPRGPSGAACCANPRPRIAAVRPARAAAAAPCTDPDRPTRMTGSGRASPLTARIAPLAHTVKAR